MWVWVRERRWRFNWRPGSHVAGRGGAGGRFPMLGAGAPGAGGAGGWGWSGRRGGGGESVEDHGGGGSEEAGVQGLEEGAAVVGGLLARCAGEEFGGIGGGKDGIDSHSRASAGPRR